jgi:hypothetical protein
MKHRNPIIVQDESGATVAEADPYLIIAFADCAGKGQDKSGQ